MRLHFEPPFLPLQTAALAVLLTGAAFTLYARWELRRRTSRHLILLALRGGIVLMLAFILLNPVLPLPETRTTAKAPFLLLFDTSRSMNTPDAGTADSDKETRWQAARRAVLENRTLLDTLALHYDIKGYGFDGRAMPQSLDTLLRMEKPNGDRTAIGDAIMQSVNAVRPADASTPTQTPQGGMLLVSDVRDNGGNPLDAARTAKALGVPLFTLCFGKEQQGRDLQVVARRSQIFGAPNQPIELAAEIRDTGIPNATVQVDLLREGRKVQSRTVSIAPGNREVAFVVHEPQKSFTRYAIACAVVSGETNATNNRANIFLNVMDTRARVLLLEGSPSWDSKFLAQTLRADPTITLDSIYQLTDKRPFALSGSADRAALTVPHMLEEFAKYDVILLGKGYESFFDKAATDALKRWIGDRGGHLLFLRGKSDTDTPELRELEPVRYSEQEIATARIRLTEAGRSHPGFAFSQKEEAQTVVQKLPNLISATQVQGEKALAVVLARADSGDAAKDSSAPEMALIAYQRYGQGKVVSIVGQGLWRWAFLPPDLESYGKVYEEFWTQMVRWLVSESDFLPGQNVALHTDRTSYSSKETVTFAGYLRGAKTGALPQITVTAPDGTKQQLVTANGDGKSADFTATFRPMQPGEYLASVPPLPDSEKAAPATATFTVYPGQEEDDNRSADPALMRQLAAIGGGQALTLAELNTLPEKLRAAELAVKKSVEPRSAWDQGWVLALLVGLLSGEWLLRRRAGLA